MEGCISSGRLALEDDQMKPADDPVKAILIVDDQESVRVVYEVMRAEGVACWVVPSGDAAVQVLREHADEIGAAFVDDKMPVMDGLATVAKLRTIKANLPCLLATADRSVDEAAFLASGAVGVVPKPLAIDTVRIMLLRLMDIR
jgi:CheY-like chemotaxis protein